MLRSGHFFYVDNNSSEEPNYFNSFGLALPFSFSFRLTPLEHLLIRHHRLPNLRSDKSSGSTVQLFIPRYRPLP